MTRSGSPARNVAVVGVVAVMAFVVILARHTQRAEPREMGPSCEKGLPTLIDLGAGWCQPCKLMEPMLAELSHEYKGRVNVEVIDANEHPEEAQRWSVQVIPTQVLLDEDGNEVYRHVGFMAKESVVAKLREMGVE